MGFLTSQLTWPTSNKKLASNKFWFVNFQELREIQSPINTEYIGTKKGLGLIMSGKRIPPPF